MTTPGGVRLARHHLEASSQWKIPDPAFMAAALLFVSSRVALEDSSPPPAWKKTTDKLATE